MIYDLKIKEARIKNLGGKAYNLIHLNKLNFQVPEFFVLTTKFFEKFLGDDLERYKELLENYDEESRLEIIKIIKEREFPTELRKIIKSKLRSHFKQSDLIAVRSSASDEDSDNYSFAGMLESYLNIKQDDTLFATIKNCYLSNFSTRVMKYREKNKIINPSISMSVILQKMIDADYAGVMFTSNPQTNNPDETMISLVKGLGEKLVKGEVDGSDYIINSLGEIVWKDLEKNLEIPNNLILKLYDSGQDIENSYDVKRGQDIEFCIRDEKIYIVQSRIITSYNYVDKNKFRTILDNSNIIESYSGVTTPLTFTFAREVYSKVYNQTLNNFYIPKDAIDGIQEDLNNMLYFYENNIYYRLNSWYKMTALYPGYEKNKKYMENMMGVKMGLDESKQQARNRVIKTYGRFIYKLAMMKKDSKKFINKFNRITEPYYNNDFKGKNNIELLEIYKELEEGILDDFIIPITNDMGAMIFYGILTDKIKKIDIDNGEGLISEILSQQGDVESVKQSLDLIDIVEEIKNNEKLYKYFKESKIDDLILDLDKDEVIFLKIKAYLEDYGPRSMDELKLETITMLEDTTFLFEIIKQYLNLETNAETYKPSKSKEAEEKIYSNYNFIEKPMMKTLVKITKYFIKNRESLRLRRTYIYSIVRKIFIRIGINFEEKKIIERRKDIFYLTKDEIYEIINQKDYDSSSIQKTINKRKEEYMLNKNKKTYERIYFYGDVNPSNALPIFSRQETEEEEGVLSGVSGGGKVVSGIVKYVEDPNDANVEGYILMAKRTDPGWTVLFPMAKAIIIERGSALSHSAVIAREMGLTLVVGVRGLTSIIKDGDRVRVDGINGTIEVLEENNEE